MTYYIIISTADLPKINFAEFLDDNENSLTKNNDDSLCILKFKGMPPKSLNGVEIVEFVGRLYHNHSQMIELKKIVSTKLNLGWVKKENNE